MKRIILFTTFVTAFALLVVPALANLKSHNVFSPGVNPSIKITEDVTDCALGMLNRAKKAGKKLTPPQVRLLTRGCSCIVDWRRASSKDKETTAAKGKSGIGKTCYESAVKSNFKAKSVQSPFSSQLNMPSETIYFWTMDCWLQLKGKTFENYTFSPTAAALTCGCLMDGVRSWDKKSRTKAFNGVNQDKEILTSMKQEDFNRCFKAFAD